MSWLLLQVLNLCRLLAEHCPGDEDDERPERHQAEYDARVAKHQECGFLGGSLLGQPMNGLGGGVRRVQRPGVIPTIRNATLTVVQR